MTPSLVPVSAHVRSLFSRAKKVFLECGLLTLLVICNAGGAQAQTLPVVLTSPQPSVVTLGAALQLSVEATGTGSLTYQWRKNSYPIPGATGAVFDLAAAELANAGAYDVIVTDDVGSTASASAFVRVGPAQQPNLLEIDPSFRSQITREFTSVERTVYQPDGKILVCGTFTFVNGSPRPHVARLNPDGTVDPTFNPGDAIEGTVAEIVLQPDGRIVIAGHDLTYRDQNVRRGGPIRLNADGTLDREWTINRPYLPSVNRIVVQPDGKIIVAGDFSTAADGVQHNRIIRLNIDGTIDSTFHAGTGFNDTVWDLDLDKTGRIVACGRFTMVDGNSRTHFARLSSDGSLDLTFAPTFAVPDTAVAVMVQADQKVLVGTQYSPEGSPHIHRFNGDGTADTTFNVGTGFNIAVNALAQQPDGKLVVGGSFNNYDSIPLIGLIRLNLDGSVDPTFSQVADQSPAQIFKIALDQSGRILVSGAGSPSYGNPIVRRAATGALDTTFQVELATPGRVLDILPEPDGSMWISGWFDRVDNQVRSNAAKLLPDGSLDRTNGLTGSTTNGVIHRIQRQSDGQVVFFGSFWSFNDQNRSGIARLNPDGSLDPTLTQAGNMTLSFEDGLVLPDGRFLVVGWRSDQGHGVWRLLANGTFDPTFDASVTFEGNYGNTPTVTSLALQSDGRIVVGGSFTSADSLPFRGLARLERDGGLDESFGGGSTSYNGVERFEVLPDDSLAIVGSGALSTLGGNRSGYARVNADGTVFSLFAGNQGPSIGTAIRVQTDGKWLVGGTAGRTVRIDTAGRADITFAAVEVADYSDARVSTFQPRGDEQWYVGGERIRVPGSASAALVRMRPLELANDSFTEAVAFPAAGGFIATNNALATRETDEPVHGGATTDRSLWFTWTAPLDGRAILDTTGGSYLPRAFIYTGDELTNLQLVASSLSSVQVSFAVTAGTTYHIAATGVSGSTGGGPIMLTLTQPFAVRGGPLDTTARAGETVTLAPDVVGDNLTYQWRKHGFNLTGATSASLVIDSATITDSGFYDVVIQDGPSSVTTPRARLTVYPSQEPELLEIDPGFHVELTKENAPLAAVAPLANGGFVVAGYFDVVGGHPTASVAKVSADGTVDTTFRSTTKITGDIFEVVELPNGKILVGGNLQAGAASVPLLRFNADGTKDDTFVHPSLFGYYFYRFDTDAAGRIYGIGYVLEGQFSITRHLFRFRADGSFDTDYNPALPTDNASVAAVVVAPDGSAMVSHHTWVAEESRYDVRLYKTDPSGAIDELFAPDLSAFSEIADLQWGPDGTVYAIGLGGTPTEARWRRYNATTGELDTTFSGGGAPANSSLRARVFSDGRLLLGSSGAYLTDVNGTLNPVPLWAGSTSARDVAIDSTGRAVMAAGRSDSGVLEGALYRYNLDGTVDTSLTAWPALFRRAHDLVIQPDGRVIIAGDFQRVNGVERPYLARLLPDGTLDSSFTPPSVDGRIRVMQRQADGKLIISGDFTRANGINRNGVARLTPDGGLDYTFSPPSGWPQMGDFATTAFLRPLASGQVLIGGSFTPSSGLDPDQHLYRLLTNGSVDESFSPPFDSSAFSITNAWETRDGGFIVGANNTTSSTPFLARLLADGSSSPGFSADPTITGDIRALAVSPGEESWLIAGDTVHRLQANGSAAGNFSKPASPLVDAFDLAETDIDLFLQASGAMIGAGGQGYRSGTPWPVFRVMPAGNLDTNFEILGLDDWVSAAGQSDDGGFYLSTNGAVVRAINLRPPHITSKTSVPKLTTQNASLTLASGFEGRLLTYQWFKDGIAIAGATGATLDLPNIQLTDAGNYQVRGSNPRGITWANIGDVLVTTGTTEVLGSQRLTANSAADGLPATYTVTNQLDVVGEVSSLTWSVLLPTGWTLNPTAGTADSSPTADTTTLAEWSWSAVSDTALTFSYTLTPPDDTAGRYAFTAMVAAEIGSKTVETLVRPDPLVIRRGTLHSADFDGDHHLSLNELLRVIELYNTRYGNQRTGAYRTDTFSTDGFAVDATIQTQDITWLENHHSADWDANGRIDLKELLRVIEIYNYREGSTRTGSYSVAPATEDGFTPGE